MSSVRSWVGRIRNAHPDHRAIARGMVWVTFFVFVGKLAGAAKEMVVAWRYGVSAQVDAYVFVFNLVSWPVAVWFSILTVVLIPLAARSAHEAPQELRRFRSELLGFTLLLAVGLATITWLTLPFVLRARATGLSAATLALAIDMAPGLTLVLPIGIAIGLFSATMLAAGRHANTLLEGIPAFALLLAVLAWATKGVGPLVWGTITGFALHALGLAVLLGRDKQLASPRFALQSPLWSDFWQGFGAVVIGQALMSITPLVDQFFAAHLGTGAIARFAYANRILVLILSLGATTVTRATLPVFSKAEATGAGHLEAVGRRWLVLLAGLGVMAAIVGWVTAPWAVRILFERGAFGRSETEMVTRILRYGLGQLPFYFASLVLVSILVSKRKYGLLSLTAAINLVTKVAANALFVPQFGVSGLMIANSVMLAGSCLLLMLIVFKHDRSAGTPNAAGSLAHSVE